MATTKAFLTKDGKQGFVIRVSRGRGKSKYQTRWYPKPDWSSRTIERELRKAAAEFERQCENGEILNREQEREKEEAARAEAAKLKTVRQYAEGVFMPTKETTFAKTSRRNYEMFLEHYILPGIGDSLLTEVTPAMISRLILDYQRKGYAHSSAIKLYNILNGIFEMAFLDDSIQANPMRKVKRPAPRKDEKKQEESQKAYTVKELQNVLKCLENEPLKWRTYISLMMDTGARRGEICGLQWQDIDFTTGAVTIRRNLQYTKEDGVYAAAPKNGKTRTVDVGPDVLAMLSRLRAEQATSHLSKWVFTMEGSSAPMHPTSAGHYFRKFGQRNGIQDFHPHKLRHTSASIAITNGADVVSVSQRLGHSDTAVTLRMYAHANEESIRRAGQIVRDALKAQKG